MLLISAEQNLRTTATQAITPDRRIVDRVIKVTHFTRAFIFVETVSTRGGVPISLISSFPIAIAYIYWSWLFSIHTGSHLEFGKDTQIFSAVNPAANAEEPKSDIPSAAYFNSYILPLKSVYCTVDREESNLFGEKISKNTFFSSYVRSVRR